MNLSFFLVSLDPSALSRPDKHSMPQQTLLELLAGNFDDKKAFRDTDGYFEDITNWKGLKMNEVEEVTSIDWEEDIGFGLFDSDDYVPVEGYPKPGGSIDLSWIPHTVVEFMIPDLELHGTIDTFELPRGLVSLDCDGNKFQGTLDTSGLPDGLEALYVSNNKLSGTLDIAALPSGLHSLTVAKNQFSGTLSFRDLPQHLQYCTLSKNAFSGEIDLSVVSPNMKHLRLEGNAFDIPRLLVAPEKEIPMLLMDRGCVEEIVTTEGTQLTPIKYIKDTEIRVQWPQNRSNEEADMEN